MAATQKKKQQEAPAPQIEARIDRMVDGDYKTKAYASVIFLTQTLTDRFFFSNGTYAQPRIDGRAFYRCLASPRAVTCGTPQRSEVLPAGRRAQQVKVPSVPAPPTGRRRRRSGA